MSDRENAWKADSLALGAVVAPVLEKLTAKITKLSAALVCTPDGFNVCSLGMDKEQVGKVAAIASSLISVGNAAMQEISSRTADHQLDVLSLRTQDTQVVAQRIEVGDVNLVLFVAAENTTLGQLMMTMTVVADDVTRALGGEPDLEVKLP